MPNRKQGQGCCLWFEPTWQRWRAAQEAQTRHVDLALPSTVMTSVAPEFGVFEMPYLVQDRGHAARIADKVVRPVLGPIAEKAGYHILGVWENGYREITNNKKPIVKPEDLQGIKLRVPGGVWRVKMFKAYGATRARWSSRKCSWRCRPASWMVRKIR